jgi:hypothetical protein
VGLLLASVPAVAQEMETVTVTGYRASLASSTNAKRDAVGFTDSVFAEDIGKFPDTNIAEAFNRIPGITISRENDGSGMRVSIRGLDTNHVKITLNGAAVQTASTGNTDAGGANREVDLNIFPIELFTQLSVSKTAQADQLEGGAAGVIAMRSARPFDNPGMHFTYNLQASDYARNGNPGGRGTLIASTTEGKFGVLVGVSGQWNRVMITGYEGAFNNLTTPSTIRRPRSRPSKPKPASPPDIIRSRIRLCRSTRSTIPTLSPAGVTRLRTSPRSLRPARPAPRRSLPVIRSAASTAGAFRPRASTSTTRALSRARAARSRTPVCRQLMSVSRSPTPLCWR